MTRPFSICASRREVLRATSAMGMAVGGLPITAATAAAGRPAPSWATKPFRNVQTNLRMTDARRDPRTIVREVREFGATGIVANIGGIFAFYPTELEFHTKNPYLRSDFIGELADAAHTEGLVLIGRYDLSKSSLKTYQAHPEWFRRNREGGPLVNYETYQACVNGGWYRDYAQRIVTESLRRYPIDGMFVNMFGYINFDYAFRDHGICVCNNCRDRFHAMFGRDLPRQQNFSDPAWRDYLLFQERTVLELGDLTYETAKTARPETVVMAVRPRHDAIRYEVAREMKRPQPEWPHLAGEQARFSRSYGGGKPYTSLSANFIDFMWRRIPETGDTQVLRMAQLLANGGSLDYYVLGTLEQEDRRPQAAVRNLFAWHAANAEFYENLRPASRVGLYMSHKSELMAGVTATEKLRDACFKGAYLALIDARIPFEIVTDDRVQDGTADLSGFDAIIMPNIAIVSAAEAKALDAFVTRGGLLITTGETAAFDERAERRPAPAIHAMPITQTAAPLDHLRGASYDTAGSQLDLAGAVFLMHDGPYFPQNPSAGAISALRLRAPERFGPPELCFPESADAVYVAPARYGAIAGTFGKGKAVHLPWLPDMLYRREGLPDHRRLFEALLARYIPAPDVRLAGTGPIELTVQGQPDRQRRIVHLVNYSGQRNNRYEAPVACTGLRLGLKRAARSIDLLVARTAVTAGERDAQGYTWFALPPLGAFEAISIRDG